MLKASNSNILFPYRSPVIIFKLKEEVFGRRGWRTIARLPLLTRVLIPESGVKKFALHSLEKDFGLFLFSGVIYFKIPFLYKYSVPACLVQIPSER